MKKRNWLMTIAFAVLSLTIVSTMVIGTTYAKFTSKISGNTTVRAAGFLITGSTASVSDSLLIAPGEEQDVEIELKYFSQVDTIISGEALQTSTAGNTGAFTDTNWAAIIAYYNENYTALQSIYGISDTAAAVSGTLKVADVIKVDGTAMVATFLKKISDTTTLNTAALAVDTTNHLVKAMAYDVTDPITIGLTIPVEWDTEVTGDTLDTLIGNCIAALAAPGAGYDGVGSDGSTHVTLFYDLNGNGTADSGETLTLTVASGELATGVASRVSVALGMTATQLTGDTITPSWTQPTAGGVGA